VNKDANVTDLVLPLNTVPQCALLARKLCSLENVTPRVWARIRRSGNRA
jgi:hypothetical protein